MDKDEIYSSPKSPLVDTTGAKALNGGIVFTIFKITVYLGSILSVLAILAMTLAILAQDPYMSIDRNEYLLGILPKILLIMSGITLSLRKKVFSYLLFAAFGLSIGHSLYVFLLGKWRVAAFSVLESETELLLFSYFIPFVVPLIYYVALTILWIPCRKVIDTN